MVCVHFVEGGCRLEVGRLNSRVVTSLSKPGDPVMTESLGTFSFICNLKAARHLADVRTCTVFCCEGNIALIDTVKSVGT
jgi:hypothetical protein